MTREQAAEKLKKIKALAERGVGGEKDSAMKLYRDLLEKYQIEEAEVLEDRVTLHWFSYSDNLEEDLLTQIFYKVTGSPSYRVYTGKYSRRKKRGCDCTEVEAVEIKMLFDFYKGELKREMEAFLIAFRRKNDLFPDRTARCYKEYDGPDRENGQTKKRECGRKQGHIACFLTEESRPVHYWEKWRTKTNDTE